MQLFYLMSRVLSQDESVAIVVHEVVEPSSCHVPMEYEVYLSKLIELHMEGSVG